MIDLTYGGPWIPDIANVFRAAEQIAMPLNKDINDGDPIGLGLGTINCLMAKRITSSAAYLASAPKNLSVITGALVASIILEGTRATGVRTVDSLEFFARSEVIISGGALNSPQLLLLSGIGPRDELEKHGITVRKELPMVGRNLKDHCYSTIGIAVNHSSGFIDDHLTPSPMAFLKSEEVLASAEFINLPASEQRHMLAPTVPSFEICTVRLPGQFGKASIY
jgi:choline dehydrogenase-like flavoprotein